MAAMVVALFRSLVAGHVLGGMQGFTYVAAVLSVPALLILCWFAWRHPWSPRWHNVDRNSPMFERFMKFGLPKLWVVLIAIIGGILFSTGVDVVMPWFRI